MNGGISSSEIVGTSTSSTEWPSSASAVAASRAALTHASSVGMPSGALAISPTRSGATGAPTSCANGRSGAGALYQT